MRMETKLQAESATDIGIGAKPRKPSGRFDLGDLEASRIEADIERRRAEARRHIAEAKRADAETRRCEVETKKLVGEVDAQGREALRTELEISHLQVGLGLKALALGGGIGMLVATFLLAAVEPGYLPVSGDQILRSLTWLPR